jgi:hypothetical protein
MCTFKDKVFWGLFLWHMGAAFAFLQLSMPAVRWLGLHW